MLFATSPDQLCPHELRRLIEQGLHAFNEVYCMRQSGVEFEPGFIPPTGVDEKQPPILRRAESMNRETFRFGASRIQNDTKSFFGGAFATLTHMEAGKEEKLHLLDKGGTNQPRQ